MDFGDIEYAPHHRREGVWDKRRFEMSDTKPVSIMVADYEIPTAIFIEIVKYHSKTGIWASPSHAQEKPHKINYSAILKWFIDDEGLYAKRITGEKVYLSKSMPAMKIVLVEDKP